MNDSQIHHSTGIQPGIDINEWDQEADCGINQQVSSVPIVKSESSQKDMVEEPDQGQAQVKF